MKIRKRKNYLERKRDKMTVENFKLPVGRIVGGNPAIAQQKLNFHTRQPEIGKDGQPVKEWRCDIAISKQEFMEKVWPTMVQEAIRTCPQAGNIHPDQYDQSKFAFKIVNGDSAACPQGSKVPYNTREGYPGHYIIKIRTSAFAPGVFKFDNGAYRQVAENEIKTGDYVVANVNLTAHADKDGGLYWNPNGFELVGYGQEIKSSGSANPEELFGRQTYQLPAGASATPVGAMSSAMPMPQTGFTAPAALPTVSVPASFPSNPAMPAPAHDFVQNAGQPVPQMGFTTPAAPAAAGLPSVPPMGNGTAPFATTFVTR